MIRKMEQEEREKLLAFISGMFGFDLKDDYDFYTNENGMVYMVNREASILAESYGERIAKIGLLLGHTVMGEFVPANNFIQLFGHRARNNVVELSKAKTHIYIEGFDVEFDDPPTESGCVILRYDGMTLGRGHMRNFVLENRIPKERCTRLRYL
jgi:NOL1/NOP2/fmu family ribosome biogenesis protein